MAYRCEICNKKSMAGSSQRHRRGVAGKRWNKRAQETSKLFSPNLQSATIVVNNIEQKIKACTRCIKRLKSDGLLKAQVYKNKFSSL